MTEKVITGVLVEESNCLNLEEFAHAIRIRKEVVIEMVEFDLIHPHGATPEQWRFDSISIKRGKTASSFYRDLEVNMSGIALALDLLDQISDLKKQLKLLGKDHSDKGEDR